MTVARALTFSQESMDSLRSVMHQRIRRMGIPARAVERSAAYGDRVARHLGDRSRAPAAPLTLDSAGSILGVRQLGILTLPFGPVDSSSKQHDYFASPAEAHDAALERAWVEGISTGDVTAFESMFSAYKSDLGAFVESYVHSREAAEDIIQDLFLRIWKQRHVWDLSVPLNVYLFRAARNGGISYLRHQRVEARFRERIAIEEPVPGMQGFGVGADAGAEEHELEAAIERAVAELPIRCREVFRLNRYHHLSYADVARVLQISVKTVEVQMGRALIFLRKRLAEWRD